MSSSLSDKKNGFTLVELLVSISIMLVITTTVLFNQSHYTAGASLKNNADNLGLSLRQAQIYGTSVREFATGSGNFSIAYGLHFDITASGSNTAYIFFANGSGPPQVYNGNYSCPIGGTSECLGKTTLSPNNTIDKLYAILSDGSKNTVLGRVDITFQRPLTNATLVFFNAAGNQITLPTATGVRIELLSSSGARHAVEVYTTGQISVQ